MTDGAKAKRNIYKQFSTLSISFYCYFILLLRFVAESDTDANIAAIELIYQSLQQQFIGEKYYIMCAQREAER